MERLDIYLRGGSVITMHADKFTVTKNGFGEVTKLGWTGLDEHSPEVMSWKPDEIAAVTIALEKDA